MSLSVLSPRDIGTLDKMELRELFGTALDQGQIPENQLSVVAGKHVIAHIDPAAVEKLNGLLEEHGRPERVWRDDKRSDTRFDHDEFVIGTPD